MKPKKSARVRKPKPLLIQDEPHGRIWLDIKDDEKPLAPLLPLYKKMHAWLGKAIKYLEGKK